MWVAIRLYGSDDDYYYIFRLAIHVEDLQRQLKGTSMKLDAVTEMWKEIDQEKLKMMKQMQEMRLAIDSERIARKQAEQKLLEANQEVISSCKVRFTCLWVKTFNLFNLWMPCDQTH